MRKLIASALLKYVPIFMLFAPLTACAGPQKATLPTSVNEAEGAAEPAPETTPAPIVDCSKDKLAYDALFKPYEDWTAAMKPGVPPLCGELARAYALRELLDHANPTCVPMASLRTETEKTELAGAKLLFAALKENKLVACSEDFAPRNDRDRGLVDPTNAAGMIAHLLMGAGADAREAGFSTTDLRNEMAKVADIRMPELRKELHGTEDQAMAAGEEIQHYLNAGLAQDGGIVITPDDKVVLDRLDEH